MQILELWIPIVATGLATHVASTIAWVVLPHHRPEWKRHPLEQELLDWIAASGTGPGQYLFPYGEGERREPEAKTSAATPPQGELTLWAQPVSMGKAIPLTLAYFFVVAWLIAYLASMAFEPGAAFVDVFRFVFTAALLTHALGMFPHVFWFPRRYAMDIVDGVVFSAITAGLFAWLWPGG